MMRSYQHTNTVCLHALEHAMILLERKNTAEWKAAGKQQTETEKHINSGETHP